MMREKIKQILDSLPEEELENVYWSIVPIQEEYLFKQNLIRKGVEIIELDNEAEKIINSWDRTFAKNISEELKEAINYDQYKWHIFSYEKKNCLKEEEARAAFDALCKDEVYVMYQGFYCIYHYKNVSELVAADFDSQEDIYIFDKSFTWTYVRTHESMCGPYFYKVE